MSDNLTWQKMLGVYTRLRAQTILIYAVSDAVADGKVIHIEATDYTHECYIFATEEAAQRMADAAGVRLMHIRDMPIKVPPVPGVMEYRPDEPMFTVRGFLGHKVR